MSGLNAFADKPRWIAWRNETRNGRTTKVPHAPQGGKARADDPSTWGTRATAEARAAKIVNGAGGGIGIQLGDLDDGNFLAGIDLDSCIVDDGTIAPWAADLLSAVPTYAEKSPSGRGIKLFLYIASEAARPFLDRLGIKPDSWGCRRAALGEDARNHGPAVELYLARRYFAFTDDKWPDAPDDLATLDGAQLAQLAALIPPAKASRSGNRGGADASRSARAFRIGLAMHGAGKSFEEFCEAVRIDPVTVDWYDDKGVVGDGRELGRIWEKAARHGERGLDLVRASDVVAQPVRWVWPGRIARGKVTMLAGDPGVGKSQLALAIAAIVTIGGEWPVDGARADRGSVIIFSAEDAADDTIRPRLEAVGADLERCHILRESGGGFSLADDLSRLETAITAIEDVALVIIDPITAYLGSINSHNNAQVRGLLGPLGELATRCGAAVLAVSHLSKSGEGEAISRVSGSIGFVAAARAAYLVSRDPNDDERRLLLPLKNNLGDDRTGYAYCVEPVTLPNGIETSRVVWAPQAVTLTVAELFNARGDHGSAPSRLDLATQWLRAKLADGPVPQPQIKTDAETVGYSWATVRRAKDKLGIVPEKTGFDGGWAWALPDKAAAGDRSDE
jgi:putative DNA primase/helicase